MAILKYAWAVVFSLLLLGIIEQGNVGVEGSHQVFPESQSLQALNVNPEQRTGYHFQPPKNWINVRKSTVSHWRGSVRDSVTAAGGIWAMSTAGLITIRAYHPNGPMHYNGIYHLFYQYNPNGSIWGNIVWAHSVSTDLINWTPLDPAIYPSKPFDINGCWSGSATILPGNKPVILYTGIDVQKRQVQNVAVPKDLSDPYLREWVKPDYNPLIVPVNGINVSEFRDPTTAWLGKDGHWRLLVGSRRKHRGMAMLYKSKDFKFWWKVQHPLHSSADTGMWECPDFYPVALQGEFGLETSMDNLLVKHVLKVSLDNTRFEYYTVGRYFEEQNRYVPDITSADNAMGLRYDYGNFYASKTFYDSGKNRRILWGWANESDTKQNDISKGWAGIQTIPRKVWLDGSGKQLLQWPIEEITTLRGSHVQFKGQYLTKGYHHEVPRITAAQADVEVTFYIPHLDKAEPFDSAWVDAQQLCAQKGATVEGAVGPFGLLTLASKNLEEYTPVFFRVFKAKNKHVVLMCSDQSRSSLRTEVYKPSFGGFVDVDLSDGLISLRSLIDHSVVESFGAGGKTCITSRVYPTLAMGANAHLFAFNNGTQPVEILKMTAWNMNKPSMN